jgi:outer membrane lipoprotein carrier protein
MKYAHVILVMLMCITIDTIAQRSGEELTPQDPKAKEILDALSTKAKAYKSFTADFEYVLENKENGINEKQLGKLRVKGQNKYIVQIAGREITCNGETIWTFIEDNNYSEVTISDIPDEDDQDGNFMNPTAMFQMYKTGFKYQHDGQVTIDGVKLDVIKMFPMNPGKAPYHTIMVYVDVAKMELASMVVKGKEGNVYTYKLKNFKTNVGLVDAEFEFDEDRADDVIDLRD